MNDYLLCVYCVRACVRACLHACVYVGLCVGTCVECVCVYIACVIGQEHGSLVDAGLTGIITTTPMLSAQFISSSIHDRHRSLDGEVNISMLPTFEGKNLQLQSY